MKLVILVPSLSYMGNAGARIRYGRIAPALAEAGINLSIEDIARFDPRAINCDVVVISKCYDARALVAAEILSRRNILVGVDLFDDYFSQNADSRLNRLRAWLQQIIETSRFALCSTPAMESLVATYSSELLVHLLNDAAPSFDNDDLAALLREKQSEARASRRIRLAWFGIGDNPNFPVGLSDVSAFAGMIGGLATDGWAVDLSISTNVRAIDSARLAMIANLPVATTVEIWSEENEAELLRKSLACFLPVNAQRFSIAKSLNRAVTALANGCQILSAGYPLYAPLDSLVYRNAANFVDDLRGGTMRLAPSSLDLLHERIEEFASPGREVEKLAAFFRNLIASRPEPPTSRPLYLIHGFATNAAAHGMVKMLGGLSVGSPFCAAPLDFDVLFQAKPGQRLSLLVSRPTLSRVLPAYRKRVSARGRISGRKYWEVIDVGFDAQIGEPWTNMSLSLELALYPALMRSIGERLDRAFGPGRALVSEDSHLPFEPASGT